VLLQEATTLRKQNANLQAALSKSQEESAVLAARLEEAHAAAADNQQLLAVVQQAAAEYGTAHYRALQQRCMALDVSWDKPAAEWESLLVQVADQQQRRRAAQQQQPRQH
jgi:glycogen synthase